MATEEIVAASTTALGATLGTVTIATGTTVTTTMVATTVTTAAPGILGWFGVMTTSTALVPVTTTVATTVALPISGIVIAGSALCYGAYKTYKYLTNKEEQKSSPNQNQ